MAVFAVLASCKKNSDEIANEKPSPEEKLSPDIELVVKGATEETPPLYPPFETYNFLGFGYDAADKFNDEVSIRASVVDDYIASGSRINIIRSGDASWRTLEAENAADLS